jgi:hypothetical protein
VLVRPVLTYGSENWSLKRKDKTVLLIFDRRILRIIYAPIKEDQGINTNCENYIMNQL